MVSRRRRRGRSSRTRRRSPTSRTRTIPSCPSRRSRSPSPEPDDPEVVVGAAVGVGVGPGPGPDESEPGAGARRARAGGAAAGRAGAGGPGARASPSPSRSSASRSRCGRSRRSRTSRAGPGVRRAAVVARSRCGVAVARGAGVDVARGVAVRAGRGAAAGVRVRVRLGALGRARLARRVVSWWAVEVGVAVARGTVGRRGARGHDRGRLGPLVRGRLGARGDDRRAGDGRGARGQHRDHARLGRERARARAGDQLGDPLRARRPGAAGARGRRPLRQRQRDDRRRRRSQGQPRAVHELAHRALAHAELARDLLLRAPLHGDPQQRLALALGQRGEAGERLAHDRAPLHLLLRRVGAAQRVVELRVVVAGDAELVERDVVDDPVQPRPQVAHVVAALQRAPRRDVRLLERVLGPRLGQIAPRRPQQRPAIALDDRLERPLMPVPRESDQPLVGLGAQQYGRRRRNRHAPATRECPPALRRNLRRGSLSVFGK